jgi:NAD(P)-dependent dehydrogenase (short-subunit alcohol dehydrogenase family)
MTDTLKGKAAVITGGGSGINLAIAQRFAEEGAAVGLIGRTQEKLDAAANSLYKSIHLLRRTLEPDLQTGRGSSFVVLTPDLIGLNPEIQISVDADIFERGLSTRSNLPLWTCAMM